MFIDRIYDYNSKFSNAKTILDDSLTLKEITQEEYDLYYPKIEGYENNTQMLLTQLSGSIGHKSVGNYTTKTAIFDNPQESMKEIVRSNNKYKVLENCNIDIVNTVTNLTNSLNLIDLLPNIGEFVSFQDIFDWVDAFGDLFENSISELSIAVLSVLDSFSVVKDSVKQFVDNIVELADNISMAGLFDSPCFEEIGSMVFERESTESIQTINNLITGNKADIISSKIDSFKI